MGRELEAAVCSKSDTIPERRKIPKLSSFPIDAIQHKHGPSLVLLPLIHFVPLAVIVWPDDDDGVAGRLVVSRGNEIEIN